MGFGHRVVVAIFGALVTTAVASAQPLERGDFRLVWKAPAGCPTDREALARIEALLGARVTDLLAAPLAARATVTQTSATDFELLLETFQGEQRFTRTMRAASCAELTDAGALVLALAIDPKLRERTTDATVAPPEPSEPPKTEPSSNTAETATPAPPKEKPVRLKLRERPLSPAPPRTESAPIGIAAVGAATVDFGTIATAAVGPELGIAGQWRGLEAMLGGLWLPTRRTFVQPGKAGDITLLTAFLRACYRPLRSTVQIVFCASFELGRLSGEGVGTADDTQASTLWAAPGASASVSRTLGAGFFATLGGGAAVPTEPILFTLENIGAVHSVWPIVVRAQAGIGAQYD